MGIALEIDTPEGWHAALAALDWQLDLGVEAVVGDAPVSAYDLPERVERAVARPPVAAALAEVPAAVVDPVAVSQAMASAARTLDDLRAAVADYPHCELKKGARNTVFADGNPAARVLILGEAPGREEDLEGRPFVGRAGQLLDRMFAAIGMGRDNPNPHTALYIFNVMPWRPPQNRDPVAEEIAMMLPFVARHIELADPEVIVLMGNTPLFAATGAKGILRRRGTWITAFDRPALPMTHPAYLLRNPAAKREAWADLLALQARLR